jgi:hypothetical protein
VTDSEVVRPRTLSRGIRFLIGGVLFIASWVLLFRAHGGVWTVVVVVLALLGMVVLLNGGFRPRVRGPYLIVSTVCGRQYVDLSALTRIIFFPSLDRSRGNVRLGDSRNALTCAFSRLDDVREAFTTAFTDADARGVAVPRSARTVFGLPPKDDAPRWGYRSMLAEALVLTGLWALGLVVVLVAWSV